MPSFGAHGAGRALTTSRQPASVGNDRAASPVQTLEHEMCENHQANPHAPQGDVRGSSRDARYAGVVFTGPWRNAIRQARNAPEHPIPYVDEARAAGVSLGRYELLKFLRLL